MQQINWNSHVEMEFRVFSEISWQINLKHSWNKSILSKDAYCNYKLSVLVNFSSLWWPTPSHLEPCLFKYGNVLHSTQCCGYNPHLFCVQLFFQICDSQNCSHEVHASHYVSILNWVPPMACNRDIIGLMLFSYAIIIWVIFLQSLPVLNII
jgi:hypothetical protein